MRPRAILESSLYVDDLQAAERFYRDVLGLEFVSHLEGRHVFFRCGGGMLLLFRPQESSHSHDVPPHGAHGPGHLAFRVDACELEAWRRRLNEAGVSIEQEVLWGSRGRSLYFRDPAGNSLELAMPTLWGMPDD